MVMMLSFGAILTIAMVVFAGYGVLYWLFGGSRAASTSRVVETRKSSMPAWLTPVVLVGLVVLGLRAGMQFWFVTLGSVFAVVMLVKLNILSFASDSRPAASTPPPLPRDGRFQNATHHTRLQPSQAKSGFGAFAAFATAILVVGFTVFSVYIVREDRIRSPRALEMVAIDEWSGAIREAQVEMKQGMHEFKKELHLGAREIAQAAKESTRVVIKQQSPPSPVQAPTPPVVTPAIPPTQPERIDRVLGRNNVTIVETPKKSKKAPKPAPAPAPQVREPALRIDFDKSPTELADLGTDKSPNGLYIVLTDPKDPMDDYQAAFQRALALLKNHLIAKHPGLQGRQDSLNLPSFAWCEANGLIHKRSEPVENVGVLALGTNFSPKAMDLAYNYHLGCERTREAAKGYFGGLLVLGGLGLLLRIGTGIRPKAPVPSA
jgi:hypothetical protein